MLTCGCTIANSCKENSDKKSGAPFKTCVKSVSVLLLRSHTCPQDVTTVSHNVMSIKLTLD